MTGSVTVWRVFDRRYREDAFTGRASARFGGRWNLPGTRVVYCGGSLSLATLELLVHVEDTESLRGMEWLAAAVALPGPSIHVPPRLPESWRTYPCTRDTQAFGSDWAAAGRRLALRVPSAVIPSEFNYILNPAHPGFRRLKRYPPRPFDFDRRLLGS
jgi:RES domain-containing protein